MPSPNRYKLASTFDENKMHDRGSSFGINHQFYKKVYNECLPEAKGWTEPGCYNIKSFVDINKANSRKMTFGARIEGTPTKGPGPGEYQDYENESLNPVGRYSNGKNKNSGSRVFSKDKRRPFVDAKENIQIDLNNRLANIK